MTLLPSFLSHLLYPAGQTTLSFQLRRAMGLAFRGFPEVAASLIDWADDPARGGLPDEGAVEQWLDLTGDGLNVVSPLSRWERLLARDGGALLGSLQTVLLEWFGSRLPAQGRPLRVHIPNGMAGLVMVALFDFLELAEHAAELLGEPWRAPVLHLTYTEGDEQAAELGRTIVNGFFGWEPGQQWVTPRQGPRMRATWQARRLAPGEGPRPGEVDVVFAAYLDGETFDAAEVDRWRAALSPDGELLMAARPTATRNQVVSPLPPLLATPDFKPVERVACYFLDRYFGHDELREGQWAIISRALSRLSVLGVLPTGAGKSICFQLPALLTPGTTIVVAPLVSLIHDQVKNLRRRGMDLAGYVTGDMDEATRKAELERLYEGRYKLFYISPERLQLSAFIGQLQAAVAAGRVRISFLVIDEAHCASEWGHDFRPSYLYLPDACALLAPNAPVIALTATASRDVRTDVLRMFAMPDEAYILPRNFDRPELVFEVVTVPDDAGKLPAVLDLLRNRLPEAFGYSSHDDLHRGTHRPYRAGGMLFTPYRRQKHDGNASTMPLYAYDVCAWLQNEGYDSEFYYSAGDQHQDHDALHNQAVQAAFTTDRLPLVVATKGFGTGLDKPNVRYVIHMSYASALEGYYQEAGRAGRDRDEARVYVLYVPRHPDCHEQVPECARPGVFKCPYGLEGKCSYGVQALMTTSSFPGVDAELAHHVHALETLFVEHLGRAATCEVPLSAAAPEETGIQALTREKVERTLGVMKQFGLVGDWNWAANQKVYYASPLAVDPVRVVAQCGPGQQAAVAAESGAALLEAAFVAALRVTRREARRLTQFYQSYLAPQVPKGKKARIDPSALRRPQDRDTRLEKLLYRLKRLGLVSHYTQVASSGRRLVWRVECVPTAVPGVREGLEKALHGVLRDDARGVDTALARYDEEAPTTLIGAVGAALEVWLEAYYSVYARRRFEMLANIEAYCATTECRKRRIMNYLNEHLTFGDDHRCGRCDNCGVRPLEEGVASAASPAVDDPTPALARVLAADFLETDLADAMTVFKSARMVTALRDRCHRHLEERPDDLNARTLAALAAWELGDEAGADEGFRRALDTARGHQSRDEVERLLGWMPGAVRLACLVLPAVTGLMPSRRVRAWRHQSLQERGERAEANAVLLRELRSLSAGWRETVVSPPTIEVPTP